MDNSKFEQLRDLFEKAFEGFRLNLSGGDNFVNTLPKDKLEEVIDFYKKKSKELIDVLKSIEEDKSGISGDDIMFFFGTLPSFPKKEEMAKELAKILQLDGVNYKKLAKKERSERKKNLEKQIFDSYIRIEENVEKYGYLWKKVSITLPDFGNFKGYNIVYFVSDKSFTDDEFKNLIDSEIEKEMILFDEIIELMRKIKLYMGVCGVSMDRGLIINRNIENWRKNLRRTDVGDFLKKYAGFSHDFYYVRDIGLFDEYEYKHLILQCSLAQFCVRDNGNFSKKHIVLVRRDENL